MNRRALQTSPLTVTPLGRDKSVTVSGEVCIIVLRRSKMVAVERAKDETLKKIKQEFNEKLRQKAIEVMGREKEIEVKIR